MKKDTLSLFMTAFILVFMSISISPFVFAQGVLKNNIQTESQIEKTSEVSNPKLNEENINVEYTLPYPGILNDHPLYFLKKFRDQLLDFLIADPVKKAEFYLLQSDKFLSMAMMHESQKKAEITKDTAKLSVGYMDKAVDKLNQVKSGGVTPPSTLVDKLLMSKAKHIEIFKKISQNFDDQSFKDSFSQMVADLENLTIGLIPGE